jgi:hypothetical protein
MAGDQDPVIPFVEVVNNVIVPPLQIGAIWLKRGVVFGLTVTVIVAAVAHCPAVGVNVYVVVLVLFIAGDHAPAKFSIEFEGSENDWPEQIGPTWVKVGTAGGPTTTVIVAVDAHCPAAGVNVYVVVAVLFIAGDQLPEIALFEEEGRVNVPPLQIGATWVNVGDVGALTVTDIVVVVAHCPAVGVNV